ncbi:SDR family NAD(P)-dependent oxidoreductase [Glycomyces xiaoerkulensis]|uniref:SDR family NAD(P)-dependent oxidoreductase n=1 Tax=Glycomyces xiaoerkulensis TaxID=2038139 RepID=UPI0018E4B350|nr:SDR family oxidoreductase [Glycomyces xiaoerkulensis]
MTPDYDFFDRPVLITGASHGLGLATATLLASVRAPLALCARNAAPLNEVADELRKDYGVTVFSRAVDVTDELAAAEFVADAAKRLGDLAGVVANAGGGRGTHLEDTSPEDWQYTWSVNVVGAMTPLRAATPQLERTGGAAVLVSSISGAKPAPGLAYGATKAALDHAAAILARDLGARGVRVNAVAPGSMLVPGRRWDRMRTDSPEEYEAFRREFPGGELVDPDDVAAVVAFLLSDGARAVNGAVVPVDAGQNAPTAFGY